MAIFVKAPAPVRVWFRVLVIMLIAAGPGCQTIDRLRPGLDSADEAGIAARYLDGGDIAGGIAVFKARVERWPQKADTHHWLGRLVLADRQIASALPHLERAVRLEPNADRFFWLGVAQGANGKAKEERRSYQEAIRLDVRHERAWTYLGHNYLESGERAAALMSYDQALQITPDNPQALYNRAAILQLQKQPAKAREAWRNYLEKVPMGALAIDAVRQLNALGDFSYRNHPIGRRLVPLPLPRFMGNTAELDGRSCQELQPLRRLIGQMPEAKLDVVVHQKGNRPLAAARARAVKACLGGAAPALDPNRIRLSWFDTAELVRVGQREHRLDFSVRFFCTPGSG